MNDQSETSPEKAEIPPKNEASVAETEHPQTRGNHSGKSVWTRIGSTSLVGLKLLQATYYAAFIGGVYWGFQTYQEQQAIHAGEALDRKREFSLTLYQQYKPIPTTARHLVRLAPEQVDLHIPVTNDQEYPIVITKLGHSIKNCQTGSYLKSRTRGDLHPNGNEKIPDFKIEDTDIVMGANGSKYVISLTSTPLRQETPDGRFLVQAGFLTRNPYGEALFKELGLDTEDTKKLIVNGRTSELSKDLYSSLFSSSDGTFFQFVSTVAFTYDVKDGKIVVGSEGNGCNDFRSPSARAIQKALNPPFMSQEEVYGTGDMIAEDTLDGLYQE